MYVYVQIDKNLSENACLKLGFEGKKEGSIAVDGGSSKVLDDMCNQGCEESHHMARAAGGVNYFSNQVAKNGGASVIMEGHYRGKRLIEHEREIWVKQLTRRVISYWCYKEVTRFDSRLNVGSEGESRIRNEAKTATTRKAQSCHRGPWFIEAAF